MHTLQARHCGACAWLISDHAISAPIAPTAPKARYTTPVARYRTTMPTPESAYTPPSASPETMNGWKSCQLGILATRYIIAPVRPASPGRLPRRERRHPRRLAVGSDLWIHARDWGASLGEHHSAVVGSHRVVLVVGDVHRIVAIGPQLAEHAGVEVAHRPKRRIDRLHGVGALDRLERVHRNLRLGEAHLAEGSDPAGDGGAVLLEDRLVQVHRRRVRGVRRHQLGV